MQVVRGQDQFDVLLNKRFSARFSFASFSKREHVYLDETVQVVGRRSHIDGGLQVEFYFYKILVGDPEEQDVVRWRVILKCMSICKKDKGEHNHTICLVPWNS